MTQATTNPSPVSAPKAGGRSRPNIYTVLLAIAVAVLLAGVAYLWYTNTKLTDNGNPFMILPPAGQPAAGRR